MTEYDKHIEEYLNYWHGDFSKLIPTNEWGNKDGSPEIIRNGTQIRYTLKGNSVVVQQTGRNSGKVITVFSNSPGTRKGLGKGNFIPWR